MNTKDGYKELSTIPDFPKQERETIAFWESVDIVKKLKKLRKNAEEKVYYDGPITANNMPHYGHGITWSLKDVVPRYWSMCGYYVSRNMGWDCQGIPVEWEVEKKLGLKDKSEIEDYGVEKFNKLCKESVLKYRDVIFDYEKRLGRWFDEEDMYYTMDKDYIESIWWSLKNLYSRGLLYEGYKVVPYSTRAGTPLSTHEVKDGGYKDIEDPFVTVKFRIRSNDFPNTWLLAWTTTPWTVPGNLLLSVGKKIDYVLVKALDGQYILAKECLGRILKKNEYEIIKNVKSTDLIGLEYEPPFSFFEYKRLEGLFKVVESAHTTTEEGTGIVHLAPYGAEDYDIFMSMNVMLFDYLDDEAVFTDLVPAYSGIFYKDANSRIIDDLRAAGVLFDAGTIVHRMPMCYRTKTPLIYKPIKSWYLAVTKIKNKMLSENARINWIPEHVKDGNSGQWLNCIRDWSLSRQRYWGTPMPVWVNDKTKDFVFIGSFDELTKLTGVEITDPHKPFVDKLVWEDSKNGGVYKRVSDVVDVWYDSGAVPFAKLHYPFENTELFSKKFPADYISESMDQTHLWFYTMHVLGVALFNKIPYENVVVSGMLLDENGDKLSKSKGNYVPMNEVLDMYGSDVLRYFLLTSPIVVGEFTRYYEQVLKDARKDFFLPLWNSLKYFITYANQCGFKPDTYSEPVSKNLLDRWILARLQEVVNNINEKMDNYLIMEAARTLQPFVNDLSIWYIRRSRNRIRDGNKNALETLHYVIVELSKLCAPFLPFISEEIYKSLDVSKLMGLESVHLCLLSESKSLTKEQKQMLRDMNDVREVVSVALSLRAEKKIKVRQPLKALVIDHSFGELDMLIMDEVNVKSVVTKDTVDISGFSMVGSGNVFIDTTVTDDLKIEGETRELIRNIQSMRKKQGLNVSDKIKVVYKDTKENRTCVETYREEILQKVGAKLLEPGNFYEITKV